MKMQHLTSVIICLWIFQSIACTKRPPLEKNTTNYSVEDFRKNGMSDFETIQAACDSMPENATLNFDNKTYMIDHTVFVKKSIHFKGPATLMRENQTIYTLKQPAHKGDLKLVLNSTKGLRVQDRFLLSNGDSSFKGTTSVNLITKISGDTISLYYPMDKFLYNNDDFSVGTIFLKDVKFFWVVDANMGKYPTQSCAFTDLTFDGNRYHNQASNSWLLHTGLMVLTKGRTTIKDCTFINNPAENIVGHNTDIVHCTFRNLNGSAFHTSADRLHVAEDEIHSNIIDNYFENTNEVPTAFGGHSEGCITHSNSGGYYTATGNTFINVGVAVIGLLYPSVSKNDWGTSDIIFENNTINTTGRLIYSIAMQPGKLTGVRIMNNKIEKLSPWDWSVALDYWPDIIIENKVNQ